MVPPDEPKRPVPRRPRLSLEQYVEGVRGADPSVLGQAITLIESQAAGHSKLAQQLLSELLPGAGSAIRVGITGVPGVGKSTFIESFGSMLTGQGHKVAVLAVDPTSGVTGGSILGDKTRMQKLSRDPNAFVRPSPSGGSLGGVTRKTYETLVICEAAGFDVVIVETVGVGQGETLVADMVDFFLVLMLPGAGDELQGIKRGILELADMLAVNKVDGDNVVAARLAVQEYSSALRLMRAPSAHWQPQVVTCSGLTGSGLDDIWQGIQEHHRALGESGELQRKRREHLRHWMWRMVQDRLLDALKHHPAVQTLAQRLEAQVVEGEITPGLAADELCRAFGIQGSNGDG